MSLGYFGRKLTDAEFANMQPDQLDRIFTTVPLGGGYSLEISPELFFTPYSQVTWTDRWSKTTPLAPPSKDDDLGFFKLTVDGVTQWADLRSAMELVASVTAHPDKMAKKTQLCAEFETQVSAGVLKDYLGSATEIDCNKRGDGGRDPRCGDPQSTNRPGADGVKPGADGVKPSTSVRPCLELGHQI